jgi:hypothetical protein
VLIIVEGRRALLGVPAGDLQEELMADLQQQVRLQARANGVSARAARVRRLRRCDAFP